jgi:hypothetical protein
MKLRKSGESPFIDWSRLLADPLSPDSLNRSQAVRAPLSPGTHEVGRLGVTYGRKVSPTFSKLPRSLGIREILQPTSRPVNPTTTIEVSSRFCTHCDRLETGKLISYSPRHRQNGYLQRLSAQALPHGCEASASHPSVSVDCKITIANFFFSVCSYYRMSLPPK